MAAKLKLFRGAPCVILQYRWEGRKAHRGGRAFNAIGHYERIKDDPRASDFVIRYHGRLYDPEDVVLTDR